MFASRFSRQQRVGPAAEEPPLYEDGNHTLVVILTFALFVIFILIYLAAGLIWASSVTAAAVVLAFFYLKTRRCAILRRGRRAHVSGISSGADGIVTTAIPAFAYKRTGHEHGAAGWAQCVICLGMVKVGEMVRQLPACKHLFHVECIDMWLHSHSSCPICRSVIFPAGRSSSPPVGSATGIDGER